ncbi:TetR/AcrR family transcriptional regulator [Neorhizobium sp. JUb45]|uniref:TetR/AcrR family transcriptional regulator n=1 Tax=Neorhizobium sp. JUb45 TaxID=2485113 RepID=UPI001047BF62|nr:TetR/AcrR family transcriptional regulator [Neorhizobium sp. JUb45]TCQ99113.1 TetR family transcriptional regulator [Neorhizobium sp. JUb45]
MKVSREKAEENRQNVIETSSRLFRERGFDGVGVSTLMQAAGLTHGGFYKQFQSKDDLIAQATQVALNQTRDRIASAVEKDSHNAFDTVVRYYLSDWHRSAVGDGCALAALGPDVARQGPEVRNVMQKGVEEYLQQLEASVKGESDDDRREQAIATLSTLVGALMLSRAVEDRGLSDEILAAATRNVLSHAADKKPKREPLQ